MTNNELNPVDESLRCLLAAAVDAPEMSDKEIESLLNTAEPLTAFTDEQARRIIGKVNRLVATAPISVFADSEARHREDAGLLRDHRPRLVSISSTEVTQRPLRNGAVAALMASILSLVAVVVLVPGKPSWRGISENDQRTKTLMTVIRNDFRRRSRLTAQRYQMAAKPVPNAPPMIKVAVGDEIATGEFERRRVTLPDGSVLYVNSGSQVRIATDRRVEVARGEVFVEVVPTFDDHQVRSPFEVATPNRTVTALGTKFSVSVQDSDTDVMVTQGKVRVSGVSEAVSAGQRFKARQHEDSGALRSAGKYLHTSTPQASAVLEWTRDLMTAATGPLVPTSEYSGGALVTVDPHGQSSRLNLRKFHVDVHIEDGFARTTIDQTYFNHTQGRLEGTFHFPLPTDASLSRLAMYVNGKLMEGGMAERQHARNTFEQIVHKMQDPALLEWVDGSTFKMRVFPLEPRREKRIVLSYSQRLNSLDGQLHYRFPAGHTMDAVREWSAHVRVKGGAGSEWHSQSHAMTAKTEGADLILETALKNALMDRDLVVRIADAITSPHATVPSSPGKGEKVADRPDEGAAPGIALSTGKETAESQSPLTLALSPDTGERAQSQEIAGIRDVAFSSVAHDGQQYLMLRLRPDLAGDVHRKPHHWVFLFEHSGDRNPLLARAQIEVIRTLLENAEHADTFSIVAASSRPSLYSTDELLCSAENISAAVKYLDSVHLVGALDLSTAFRKCVEIIDEPGGVSPRTGESGERKAESGESQESEPAADKTSAIPPSAFRTPIFVHVGSGMPALGERDAATLAAMIPRETQYVGIGVGRRWNQAMMKQAASRTGGLSTQINPDEEIAWRAFDVFSKLHSPRLVNVVVTPTTTDATTDAATASEKVPSPPGQGEKVAVRPDEGVASGVASPAKTEISESQSPLTLALSPEAGERGKSQPQFLLFSDLIFQGEELAAICRVPDGQPLPDSVTVTAELNGQPWTETVAVANVGNQATYLPRHWANLEIDRLLADSPAEHRETIVSLSKAMYVMSPFTSLLVLENEEMYTQYNIDRGRKDHWALYPCPDQIDVVVENADESMPSVPVISDGPANPADVISTIVRLQRPRWFPQQPQQPQQQEHLLRNGSVRFRLPVTLYGENPGANQNWMSYHFLPVLQQSHMWDDVDVNGDGIPSTNWSFQANSQVDAFERSIVDTSMLFGNRLAESSKLGFESADPGVEFEIRGGSMGGRGVNFETDRSLFVGESPPSLEQRMQRLSKRDGELNPFPYDEGWSTFANVNGIVDVDGRPSLDVLLEYSVDFRDGEADKVRQRAIRDERLSELSGLIESKGFGPEGRRFDQGNIAASGGFGRGGLQADSAELSFFGMNSQAADTRFSTAESNDWSRIRARRFRFAMPKNQVEVTRKSPVVSHRWSAESVSPNAELLTLPTFQSPAVVSFTDNPFLFGDLVSHAPGLNTSVADVMAVVEAETTNAIASQSTVPSAPTAVPSPPGKGEKVADRPDEGAAPGNAPLGKAGTAESQSPLTLALSPESGERGQRAGRIDDAARAMIDTARSLGWESITLPGNDGEPGVTVHYDGQGQHVWERVVSEGLREHVVCDGSTLWHVYREIGLASKRPFSRFHHRGFMNVVPWLLPSADELARGADVIAVNDRTVAVVPQQPSTVPSPPGKGEKVADRPDEGVAPGNARLAAAGNAKSQSPLTLALSPESGERGQSQESQRLALHMVFAADGRLSERRVVEQSTGAVLHRIAYEADGTTRVFDAEGKELRAINLHRSVTAPPQLVPDLNGLVVLPMPVRTPEVLLAKSKRPDGSDIPDADLTEDEALSLMLAYTASGNGARGIEIARRRFIEKGDTRDGLYVLLSRFPHALVQGPIQSEPVTKNTATPGEVRGLTPPGLPDIKSSAYDLRPTVEGSPLKQFVRQYVNWLRDTAAWQPGSSGMSAFQIEAPDGSFLQRLATARNLYVRWLTDEATKDRTHAQIQQEVQRTLECIATCRTLDMGWTLMSTMRPRLNTSELLSAYSRAAERFEQHSGIGLLVRRERIIALFAAGRDEEGRRLFREWLTVQLDQGIVPPIGQDLYNSCVSNNGLKAMNDFLLENVRRLIDAQMLMTVHSLTVQVRELGNLKTADLMMSMLLASLDIQNRPDVSLFVIGQLRLMQDPRANTLLDQVMELPMAAQLPGLWRFASMLAEEAGRKSLAAERLETAIQLEFASRPSVINIETVRNDYAALLAKYDELIMAALTLEVAPSADLAFRIVQAADQWRTLEEDDTAACQTASRLLSKLQQTDLAWDYLTTPLAENSGESAPWVALARSLGSERRTELASMAWARAFEFESTNPEILLEHAGLLQAAGLTDAAKRLLQQVISGEWQPRFSRTREEAENRLKAL